MYENAHPLRKIVREDGRSCSAARVIGLMELLPSHTGTRNLPGASHWNTCALTQESVPPTARARLAWVRLGSFVAENETIIDHSGSDWGFHALVFFLSEGQVRMVVFTNGENAIEGYQGNSFTRVSQSLFVATV
jgi:hypothetical protein